jgi:hypothetical protein
MAPPGCGTIERLRPNSLVAKIAIMMNVCDGCPVMRIARLSDEQLGALLLGKVVCASIHWGGTRLWSFQGLFEFQIL